MFFSESPLYLQAGVKTRQISGENPMGEKGGGCKAIPDTKNKELFEPSRKLGQGWKVHPFIKLKAGESVELANITGPGCINKIFLGSDIPCFSGMVLRFYWDGEETPSIECPMGAFFAMGLDFAPNTVFSSMVTVGPHKGLNCYWQMPFRKSARITLTNDSDFNVDVIAYQIIYKLHDVPEEAAYFHAQYRRSLSSEKCPEHTLLEGIGGKGVYVGTYMACNVLASGWWGEGEVKFYIDGDDFPTMADSGTEDYFGGAWNFGASNSFWDWQHQGEEQVYNSPYLGLAVAKASNPHGPRKYGLYRWHILDSIGFEKDLKVTIQTIGWYPDFKLYRPVSIDIASVAYWYQLEPHKPFPLLPPAEKRCDR
jgi:hypothetical protein